MAPGIALKWTVCPPVWPLAKFYGGERTRQGPQARDEGLQQRYRRWTFKNFVKYDNCLCDKDSFLGGDTALVTPVVSLPTTPTIVHMAKGLD